MTGTVLARILLDEGLEDGQVQRIMDRFYAEAPDRDLGTAAMRDVKRMTELLNAVAEQAKRVEAGLKGWPHDEESCLHQRRIETSAMGSPMRSFICADEACGHAWEEPW